MDWPLRPLLCCDFSQRPHILQDAVAWSPSSGLVFISFPLCGFHIVSRPWFWQLSDMGLFCSPSSGLLGHPPAHLLHPRPHLQMLFNRTVLSLLCFFTTRFGLVSFSLTFWLLASHGRSQISLSPRPRPSMKRNARLCVMPGGRQHCCGPCPPSPAVSTGHLGLAPRSLSWQRGCLRACSPDSGPNSQGSCHSLWPQAQC